MGLVKFGDKQVESWGFDTETIKGQPYTFQLSFNDRQIYYEKILSNSYFRKAFFKTVLKECSDGAWIFSYNLFFEIVVLFRDKVELLAKNRFKFYDENYFVEGMLENPTPRMVLYGEGKKIYFVDASRFFTGDRKIDSLEKVAKNFLEVPKMKRPSYIGERKPKNVHERIYFQKYAMVDALLTEKLGEIIIGYHNLVQINDVCFSISHLAGRAFKRNYTDGKGLDVPSDIIEDYADEARFGGYRACHIKPGVYKDIIHLDLDSAYPYAMSILPAFFKGKYYKTLKFNKFGLYKVKTILPETDRPFFQKKVYNSKGNSPHLEFIEMGREVVFWSTGYELETFKSVFPKWKFEILNGYMWKGQNKVRPLANWVKDMHKRKAEIDKDDKSRSAERQVYKLFLNTISGKADSVIFERDEIWITKEGMVEKGVVHNGSLKNFFVACFVRGIPRAITWKEGYKTNSLFEVTDSLSIERKQLSKVKLGNTLGSWGFETGKSFNTDLVFQRLGTYFYFHSKKKLKYSEKNKKTGKMELVGPVKYALQGFHSKWNVYFNLLKKGSIGKYKKLRMNKVKESLAKHQPEKILTFEKKSWDFEVDKNYRKGVLQWLKEK